MPRSPVQLGLFGLPRFIGDADYPLTVRPTNAGIDRSAAPIVATQAVLTKGLCQFCGCHGDSCLDRAGNRCDWTDSTHSCCTAESCRVRLAASASRSPAKPPVSQKPAKVAPKKRRFAGNRVDRAWNRYFCS